MKVTLRVSKPAFDDLDHIRTWLTENASSSIAATQLEHINAAFRRLRDFPRLGHGASDQLRLKTVHRTPVIIFYRVGTGGLTILRIRHHRENWRAS